MPDPDNADAPFDLDATVAAVDYLRPVAPETARHADALAAEVRRLRAERDRLQRACDEGLPREVILCPNCKLKHVEGPRHDNPALDGRTRPHHTHRCYHCGHVWDAGRWSFGVEEATGIAAELEAARADAAGLRAELNELRASMRPRPEECAVDIAAIEARANAAYPGPWRAGTVEAEGKVWARDPGALGGPVLGERCLFNANTYHANTANREFVAHAREDVPALCAELRRFVGLHAAERAVRLSYEACISFETSCRGCAKALDGLHGAEARAERAEAALADLRAAAMALCVPSSSDVFDRVTADGMRAVMERRGWSSVGVESFTDGSVASQTYAHPTARGQRFGEMPRTPVLPVARINDRVMGLGDWAVRVANWASVTAIRHNDVSPTQVLAEAIAASREAAPTDPPGGP